MGSPGSDADSIAASLSAMVLGASRVVTYRTLVAELELPVRAAQSALERFCAANAADVVATWAAVLEGGGVRLVVGAADEVDEVGGVRVVGRSVWGVGKRGVAAAGGDGGLWVAEDRLREVEMGREGREVENALRVEKGGKVVSRTAEWRGALGKGVVGGRSVAVAGMTVKNVEEGRIEEKKKKQKKGSAQMEAFMAKIKKEDGVREKERAEKRLARGGGIGIGKENAGKVGKGGKKAVKAQKPSSLARPASGGEKRKTRRIGDSDDEDEADGEDALEKEDEDDGEGAALRREAEAEEEAEGEREREKDREREMRAEVLDLMDTGQDESDLVDEVEVKVEKVEKEVTQRSGKKKGLDQSAEDSTPPPKRVRKMVDETGTDEKGYLVTKRVAKWFDADGNELPEQKSEQAEETQNAKPARTDATENDVSRQKAPLRKMTEEREQETKSVQKAPLAKTKSKTKPAPLVAKKKGKGKGGNIASFFGK